MENKNENIKELFKADPLRMQKCVHEIQVDGETVTIDYSKTHLTDHNVEEYMNKFKEMNMCSKVHDMFEGKKINFTEDRKVLHVALRDKEVLRKLESSEGINLNGEYKDSYEELAKIRDFSKIVCDKKLLGATGKVIDTIVNIGIGGSDLGPRMVCEALQHYKVPGTQVFFISNVDATETLLVFEKIDPEKTLFVIVSKTFTTHETLANANFAKGIFAKKTNLDLKDISKHHFVAVSSNKEEVQKFGISTTFQMGDYVGGRYSLWSAAGLSICLYIGFDNFVKLLKGASIMDEHFKTEKCLKNVPVMHAMIELFYNEHGYNNKCVLPYDTYLSKLPSYLQQAEMESNGKTASIHNKKGQNTGMIVWGEVGTNCQHSFFQLIHQGTRKILTEFLVSLSPVTACCGARIMHQRILYANCIAQSEALMIGKEDTNENKNFEGNKPSITIIYSKLTPQVLGSLIALYEHKIFIQGLYWGINSFDQFGVELGKKLAKTVLKELEGDDGDSKEVHDPSTAHAIKLFRYSKK